MAKPCVELPPVGRRTHSGQTVYMTDPAEKTGGGASAVGRVAVRVSKDAQRQIRGGHPWVYDASVVSVRPTGGEGCPAVAGDLAVVFDEHRDFMAIGLFDPGSPIRIRVLHQGRPRPIDGAFWRERLQLALERRGSLTADPTTDAYRWVHGENDGLPGLVLDRYGAIVVMKLYSSAWLPHLQDLLEAVEAVASPEAVVLRLARNVQGASGHDDGEVLRGGLDRPVVTFREAGLRFEADVCRGHKTGHFLDQRDNRALVRGMSAGARVLDVYACTGGFSVNAAAGGAVLVHRVDVSAPALRAARRNMALNRTLSPVDMCSEEDTVGDAMQVMTGLVRSRRRFDLVVVDPPSFASRRVQVARALRAYSRLTELAAQVIEPGGLLVQSSCSAQVDADEFNDAVDAGARQAKVRLSEVTRTAHGVDHPIGFPQGAYLKAVFANVEPLR